MPAELFGSKYHEREQRTRYAENQEPCAHCARPVRTDRPYWAVEFDEQGWYAIGSECRKLFADASKLDPL